MQVFLQDIATINFELRPAEKQRPTVFCNWPSCLLSCGQCDCPACLLGKFLNRLGISRRSGASVTLCICLALFGAVYEVALDDW